MKAFAGIVDEITHIHNFQIAGENALGTTTKSCKTYTKMFMIT